MTEETVTGTGMTTKAAVIGMTTEVVEDGMTTGDHGVIGMNGMIIRAVGAGMTIEVDVTGMTIDRDGTGMSTKAVGMTIGVVGKRVGMTGAATGVGAATTRAGQSTGMTAGDLSAGTSKGSLNLHLQSEPDRKINFFYGHIFVASYFFFVLSVLHIV